MTRMDACSGPYLSWRHQLSGSSSPSNFSARCASVAERTTALRAVCAVEVAGEWPNRTFPSAGGAIDGEARAPGIAVVLAPRRTHPRITCNWRALGSWGIRGGRRCWIAFPIWREVLAANTDRRVSACRTKIRSCCVDRTIQGLAPAVLTPGCAIAFNARTRT